MKTNNKIAKDYYLDVDNGEVYLIIAEANVSLNDVINEVNKIYMNTNVREVYLISSILLGNRKGQYAILQDINTEHPIIEHIDEDLYKQHIKLAARNFTDTQINRYYPISFREKIFSLKRAYEN